MTGETFDPFLTSIHEFVRSAVNGFIPKQLSTWATALRWLNVLCITTQISIGPSEDISSCHIMFSICSGFCNRPCKVCTSRWHDRMLC